MTVEMRSFAVVYIRRHCLLFIIVGIHPSSFIVQVVSKHLRVDSQFTSILTFHLLHFQLYFDIQGFPKPLRLG